MDDVDALDALAAAATPGPWQRANRVQVLIPPTMKPREPDGGRAWAILDCDLPADAAYIAAADPITIRALIARLRAAETVAERGYWYFLMTMCAGPDGSDLDYAVEDDFAAALLGWASDELRPALEAWEATR